MPIPIAIITGAAFAVKYGPQAVNFIKMGMKVGKALAEGRTELTDDEWSEVLVDGDQVGHDFRQIVGRA